MVMNLLNFLPGRMVLIASHRMLRLVGVKCEKRMYGDGEGNEG